MPHIYMTVLDYEWLVYILGSIGSIGYMTTVPLNFVRWCATMKSYQTSRPRPTGMPKGCKVDNRLESDGGNLGYLKEPWLVRLPKYLRVWCSTHFLL